MKKYHTYKKEEVKTKRFNANIPMGYFIQFKDLADDMGITMSELLIKLMDLFQRVKSENE